MKVSMYHFLIILLLFCTIYSQFTCETSQYISFLSKFNEKKSQNITQFQNRFQIYCKNLKTIEQTNAKNLSYTVKQYRWMDKTDQQLSNLVRVEVDLNAMKAAANQAPDNNVRSVSAAPAASVDWRLTNDVSSIKNQGTCGCCWAFTTVGLYQSWMMVMGQDEYNLSEEYILQCTTLYTKNVASQSYVSTCSGGYVDFSGKLMQVNGAPLETAYPYLGVSFTGQPYPTSNGICDTNTTYVYAKNPSVTSFNSYRNQSAVQMQSLLTLAPVGALIYASSGFMSYSSGIYSGCPSFSSSYNNINHAVIIVGYDSNGNYIVKNSWGTTWGQNGFGIVSSANDCALSAFVYSYTSTAPPRTGLEYHNQVKLTYENILTKSILALTSLAILFSF